MEARGIAILSPADETALAFIACHMRPADKDEIYNVTGHNNAFLLARQTLDAIRVGSGVVASWRGQPAAVLGVCPVHPGVCTGFAFGTNAFPHVALSLTRYALSVMRPALIAAGFHRIECKSRFDHHDAHRWLERLGFANEGQLRRYGADGSDYFQFGATA